MIEIEREEAAVQPTRPDAHYRWRWFVRDRPEICGVSRQPLLDACRALKSLGHDPQTECRLFRPGRTEWDLKTTVGYGATQTVADNDQGTRFVKWRAFNPRTVED